jgi:DNA-binding transcriptional LysR family regulator
MDRLERMRIFVEVADLASFSRAAESMGLPKATISTAIQTLEAALGARLLHRTTRKVQMTQDGIVFYERCTDLLSDVEEIEALFQQDAGQISGRIRFDVPNRIARELTPRLPLFLEKYPGIALEISSTDRIVDLVQEGFDCVLRAGRLGDSGMVARHLPPLVLVNCASPAYLARHGVPQTLADLREHRVIHYSANLGARAAGFDYYDGSEEKTVPMTAAITVNNTDVLHESGLAGMGIMQLPLLGVAADLGNGTLVDILPQYRPQPMPLSLVYPHRRHLSRRLRIFMDWLEEEVRVHLKQAL